MAAEAMAPVATVKMWPYLEVTEPAPEAARVRTSPPSLETIVYAFPPTATKGQLR